METKCKYYTESRKYCDTAYKAYVCEVEEDLTGASIEWETEIKTFTGTHEEGKSNNDVTWLRFRRLLTMKNVPRNLNKVFPNLKTLQLTHCSIESISREDLKGLENLEWLEVYGWFNKFSSLPDDLFADMKKLQKVAFLSTALERMSSRILLPIRSTVDWASFDNDKGKHQWFDKNNYYWRYLKKYMKYIDTKYSPESVGCEATEEINEGADDEWVDVEDSDSTDTENEPAVWKLKPQSEGVEAKFSELERPSVECTMFEVNKQISEELDAKKETEKATVSFNLQAEFQADKVLADFSKFKFN